MGEILDYGYLQYLRTAIFAAAEREVTESR